MRYDKKENTILSKGLSNSPIFQYLNFSFHRHFKYDATRNILHQIDIIIMRDSNYFIMCIILLCVLFLLSYQRERVWGI